MRDRAAEERTCALRVRVEWPREQCENDNRDGGIWEARVRRVWCVDEQTQNEVVTSKKPAGDSA